MISAFAQDFALNEIYFPEVLHSITKKPIEISHEIRYLDAENNKKKINYEIIKLNPDQSLHESLIKKEDQTLIANIWLARILDYELIRNKIDLNPTELRTIYVSRTILHNVYKMLKLPLGEFNKKSNDELYQILKNLVQDKDMAFPINWKYAPEELKSVHDLVQNEKIQYPEFKIVIPKLPESFISFNLMIKKQLKELILPHLRKSMFESAVKQLAPEFIQASQRLATMPELEALYEKLKAEKYSLYHLEVQGTKIEIQNLTDAQYISLSKEIESILNLNKDQPRSIQIEKIQERLTFLYPTLVQTSIKEQFSSNENKETVFPKEFEFYKKAFPIQLKKEKEKLTLLFVENSKIDFLRYLTINEVLEDLRSVTQEKYMNGGIRKATYLLFKKYPTQRTYNTCGLSHLVCNEIDETIAIDRMFNEKSVHPQIKTSLTDITTFHKAYMIYTQNFQDSFNLKLIMGDL